MGDEDPKVAEFDRGGYLRPGLKLVKNDTGKDERIVTRPASGYVEG
jgi:hypothetical protein